MELYLAGNHDCKYKADWSTLSILESYIYIRQRKDIFQLINSCKNFLLDSGAFTFMESATGKKQNWEKYADEYADFIKANNVDKFFELDIDNIVGLDNVEKLRERIESRTGKQSIPVWHKNRGKEYFIDMCKNYPYVALGGMAGAGDKNRTQYEKLFPWFITTAHSYGTKIHGLGYTSLEGIKRFHFDSVDSTTWLVGNRSGFLYMFNPKKGEMEKYRLDGKRLKPKESAQHNFNEWVKFQAYARKNL